jgi:hypothetical protein
MKVADSVELKSAAIEVVMDVSNEGVIREKTKGEEMAASKDRVVIKVDKVVLLKESTQTEGVKMAVGSGRALSAAPSKEVGSVRAASAATSSGSEPAC